MSRSNNTERPNPANRFYQWDGSKGGFSYWDKEKEERVHVDLPFGFMVLETLSTIKGWSDQNQSGFWSNEVRKVAEDSFTVRTKKGIACTGSYREVKANPSCAGAKYCQSVYIADKQNGALVIANLQLMGAALSSWIEFRKKHKDIYAGAIRVATMAEGKKGAVTYQMPVFEAIEASPESDESAKELDRELQKYLDGYFKRVAEPAEIHSTDIPEQDDYEEPVTDDGAPVDDLPF